VKVSATDMKNNFGKYLKKCAEETIYITKNDHIVAMLSHYEDLSEGYMMLKEGGAAFSYSGKRVTYEEFLEITENNEERYEYIDGEIFLLSSPGITHQIIHSNLYGFMLNWFRGKQCRVFSAPFDVTLAGEKPGDRNVVQPDLLIACDHYERRNENDRYTGIPALVIEILSPQTRSRDHVKKLNVYMAGGVSEYWIVDPKEMRVIQYCFENREVTKMSVYSCPDTVKSVQFKGLDVPTDEIFKVD
jgi:Uma2 family endonuclease